MESKFFKFDICQARSKLAIVYSRDTRNRDFVKLCGIYMVMDAHFSSRQTSISSETGLAHVRLGTDSSKLNHGFLEYGNYIFTG